jgi:hypothetical protein
MSLYRPRPRGDPPAGSPLSPSASTHLVHGPLSWNDSTVDTETDPKLAAKLQAGERIWLQRHRIVVACCLGAAAAAFVIVVLVSAEPTPLIGIALTAVSVLFAAWVWAIVLLSRLRFTNTTIETTEMGAWPFRRRLSLRDIAAARVRRVVNRSISYYVYACQATPGRGKGARWVKLWDALSVRQANTLLAELRRRCDLTEVSPISKDYHTTVWQRPGFDSSPLALEWWQK